MLDDYTYEEIESGRVETLVQAIDKIEKLEMKLKIALRCLKLYANIDEWSSPNDQCSADIFFSSGVEGGWEPAERALKEINEV